MLDGRLFPKLFLVASSLSLLLYCVCLPGRSEALSAAKSSELTTSPITADLDIPPGSTKTIQLQVEDDTPVPVRIQASVELFEPDGSAGQARIVQPMNGDQSLSWVHLSESSFVAQPEVWTPIQMTITLPKDAQLGYYYAVLFKPVTTATVTTKDTTTYSLSNAILVLVDTKSANEIRNLNIIKFQASRTIYEYLPATFNVTIQNEGNIYVVPQASIYIGRRATAGLGALATLSINQAGGRILPNSSRTFSAEWNNGFPVFLPLTRNGQPVVSKTGQAVLQLHWNTQNLSAFRFGRYYAELVMEYNNGTRDVLQTATVSFWVIPWKVMGTILLLVGLQIFGIVKLVSYRRTVRRTLEAAKTENAR